jgi:23S rRNA (cytidine1920-2'-O)/16S rRNA (cytidine1409-2'-O)-methyltransferase
VVHGLVESREKAQALVMSGRVQVDGAAATKPGTAVPDEAKRVAAPGRRNHVGRGAIKLAGALEAFAVEPAARWRWTWGLDRRVFTEILLARGVSRVYAVDVGRGQLHERLRTDPRVVVVDGVNARSLSAREVPEPCGIATLDVSFHIGAEDPARAARGAAARGRRPGSW